MRYSYDATLINDDGLNRMRFELGDVFTAEPEKTAYLSDEEILTALEGASFKRAQYRLVGTLLRRFSYEVDTKVADAEWKMHERVAEWKELYARLKAELDAEEIGKVFGAAGKKMRAPIFGVGQHDYV